MNAQDLDRIGKKMPYKVPEGFFEDMEKRIKEQTTEQSKRRNILRHVIRYAAIAATIALVWLVSEKVIFAQQDDYTSVELAFDQLSEEDQVYLLEVYQDDIFFNY
ncbi:MAG: hypothetical protein ACI31C_00910 [Muribaculaceae bacterium]